MPDFFQKREQASTGGSSGPRVPDHITNTYPCLSRMLQGTRDKKGVELIPAFSMTIFAGEGELRMAFTAKGAFGNETWFGAIPDDVDVLGAIEGQLAMGKLEAKRERRLEGRPTH